MKHFALILWHLQARESFLVVCPSKVWLLDGVRLLLIVANFLSYIGIEMDTSLSGKVLW